tara:strand:- start:7417 stop:7746 length:330 start_codon:yes stop_codon:yes gene_type:complete
VKKFITLAAILFLASCAGLPDMAPREKMALGCDASAQVMDVINDVIAADIVKVNKGEDAVISLDSLTAYEVSKNIIVGYCTAAVLDVAKGLPAVMREYSKLKLLEAGVS